MNRSVHTNTPVLSVSDPRGLTIATVNYCRDTADAVAQARCERHLYDAVGRLEAEWDPRLAMDDSAPANLTRTRSLNHTPLATESVDAGWRVSLFAETGQLIQAWDAGGRVQLIEYDQRLRPSAVFEQGCTQRYEYARAEEHFADHNQCGQLIRHDDTAGTRQFEEYGLAGEVLTLRQHFLQALDEPDWPLLINQRDALLEPGDGAVTAFRFNALGDLTVQVDAQGHRQYFNQTLDGQLREAGLLLHGKVEPQLLVRDIRYNAQGRVEQQTARNQVVSLFDYRPEDGRLTRLRARHLNGKCLQDLNYGYDPVGNILSIEDKALPVRFFANQRIESITRYIYDSLSQLIAATGWETGSDNRGPAHREAPRAVANYRQAYRYDEGGNLLELTHQGPQQHGRVLTAAKYSNRCLPLRDGRPPTEAEIAAAFDHNGNLLALDNARTLHWDVRNQLHQVTPVERDSQPDDTERYVYGADGMRQRKVRMLQTNARTVISETRYLPGLETRNVDGARLNVITVQAGRMTVQVLHWETLPSRLLANDQYRYCLGDHLGSCSLELDSDARIVSRETYHPYGSTAFSERGNSSEESYRTLGYSGKDRDATGLYYYGSRYYMCCNQRWLNPDPAGAVDGLNLYRMVRNNPVNFLDVDGRISSHWFMSTDKGERELDVEEVVSVFSNGLPKIIFSGDGHETPPLVFSTEIPDVMRAYEAGRLALYVEGVNSDVHAKAEKFVPSAFDVSKLDLVGWEHSNLVSSTLGLFNVAMNYSDSNKIASDSDRDEVERLGASLVSDLFLGNEELSLKAASLVAQFTSDEGYDTETIKGLMSLTSSEWRDVYVNPYLAGKLADAASQQPNKTFLVSVGGAHLDPRYNPVQQHLNNAKAEIGFFHQVLFNRSTQPVVKWGKHK
ncbi:RHS repeat domain-containing protein [Pseudomonas sp. S3E12]|uniref:RHS repeat domain-containing protein n=1 Tax=Pseudomonas sp. S3E12 TaxID=1873126 RepID=UPI0009F3D61A|nr:RHS repeat-associated core domain-containing protein [Pseudomonas sp. S3E12]